MSALAVIILVVLALAYLLMFAQAVRLPTPRPPRRVDAGSFDHRLRALAAVRDD